MYNGIIVSNADNAVIAQNNVTGFADMQSWIRLQNSTDASILNNQSQNYIYSAATNVSQAGNSTIQAATATDTMVVSTNYTAPSGVTHVFLSGTGQTVKAGAAGGDGFALPAGICNLM